MRITMQLPENWITILCIIFQSRNNIPNSKNKPIATRITIYHTIPNREIAAEGSHNGNKIPQWYQLYQKLQGWCRCWGLMHPELQSSIQQITTSNRDVQIPTNCNQPRKSNIGWEWTKKRNRIKKSNYLSRMNKQNRNIEIEVKSQNLKIWGKLQEQYRTKSKTKMRYSHIIKARIATMNYQESHSLKRYKFDKNFFLPNRKGMNNM